MPVRTDRVIEEFTKLLNDFGTLRADTLIATKDDQVMERALIQHEISRLEAKLGAEHPRTKRLKAKLAPTRELLDALDVEREVTEIKVPRAEAAEALLHGRVLDEKGRGISGMRVFFTDQKGNVLREVGEAETDQSGYYAIKVAPEVVEKVSEGNKDGIVLNTSSKGDKVTHKERELVQLTKGRREPVHVEIARKIVAPVSLTRGSVVRPRRGAAGPELAGKRASKATTKKRRTAKKAGKDAKTTTSRGRTRGKKK